MRFKNKVAIVTGSGSGIGKMIAKKLVLEGAKVVVTDIDEATCKSSVEELRELGGEVTSIVGDVSNAKDVQNVVNKAILQFDKIDILVNNAGILKDAKIHDMKEESWDEVIDVCLKGTFLFSKYASLSMMEQKYGKIVNISSRAHLGNPGQANYSSAKAGIVGLTKSLAKELGRNNINVNAVAPGLIETAALRNHPKYEKIKELQKKDTPLQRVGLPEDVANAVLFLASDDASYVTGDLLHVTGGRFG
ncbi:MULTISPECIES: SDR family NAD(P)-dependent oxidoreductase [Sporosarcina]|uniref:SDR family oxidoreductase n=1 Tax=Sporosarcina TaxID=1569 RepID=UPI000A164DDE|nr:MULTISPECIES: SDR family NAD(P)-dependent oxidoreductase [Sporosarcina]ARJ39582.1 beta-ketoacyl-ACP reductase [Sporosarcina ureae]PIC67999.1 NAD(P)-dependent oxidoreductase [Sporosarcina sp. P16a]PIC83096.1 NAD(P)-dependent oxidoreductase [Sporosarcina sp. P1]PIC90916.1 NAD(P)-dependent oxidoreductase [Sporosarcina sp. P21c]PIC94308.1 NAD(P)-dependent oxidoreductase [Sporosarcina sp. P25]